MVKLPPVVKFCAKELIGTKRSIWRSTRIEKKAVEIGGIDSQKCPPTELQLKAASRYKSGE